MRPKQLYRSDDSAYTMLAETIYAEQLHEHGNHRDPMRRLTIRAGDLCIGCCIILGEVASEILRIETRLAAMLNQIADEQFTTQEPVLFTPTQEAVQ